MNLRNFKMKIKYKPGKGPNRNPSPATRWKKGKSGNPAGPMPGVIAKKELKEWTQQSVATAYKNLMNLEIPDLRQIADSLTTPVLEVIIARALLRDRMEGTTDNTERILDRAIGKVPQRTEMTGLEGTPLVPPNIIFETGGREFKEGMGST